MTEHLTKPEHTVVMHPDDHQRVLAELGDHRDMEIVANPHCPPGKAYVINNRIIDEATQRAMAKPVVFAEDNRTVVQRWIDGEIGSLATAVILARISKDPRDRVWATFAEGQLANLSEPTATVKIIGVS